jgi:putative transposase
MGMNRAWQYRLYLSKAQEGELCNYLQECKNIWNSLLEYTKDYYGKSGKFPTRRQLYLMTKENATYSQVAQNVADRLTKSLKGVISRKKAGRKAGFPRFKPIERVKSFTYPQRGFKLGEKLHLSQVGAIAIRKHRNIQGKIKTLTIKKSPSGKWHAIFTSEVESKPPEKKQGAAMGIDLGIEHFAYLSNGAAIENPRHLKQAEQKLRGRQWQLSKKEKGSKNRRKARLKVAIAYENLANKRKDFLHKVSRKLAEKHSFIALENLNIAGLARGFLAKHVLDCSWAEFLNMLRYKAEEAGCEVVLVEPAHTAQECSSCGLVQKKSLAERWHSCPCGASMHRDLNAAINILNRATGGTPGSQACLRGGLCMQASSMKQEAHIIRCG